MAENVGRWSNLEQVGDNAVVGDVEDRSLGVFVDCYDDFAVLHAGEMLNGARDADGYVHLLQRIATEITNRDQLNG